MAGGHNRVLGEHREVCAFVTAMIVSGEWTSSNPLCWYDLGCGKGLILETIASGAVLQRYLPLIAYQGIDGDAANAPLIQRQLATMPEEMHGRSGFVVSQLPADDEAALGVARADLVTLTNVVHEVAPRRLPELLRQALQLLRPGGILLAYDMTELTDGDFWEEAGTAVTWTAEEISFLLDALLPSRTAGGTSGLRVSSWTHAQTSGWTLVARSAETPKGVTVAEAAEVTREVLRSMSARYDSEIENLVGELGCRDAVVRAATRVRDLHPLIRDCRGLARPPDEATLRALSELEVEALDEAVGDTRTEAGRLRQVASLRGNVSVETLQSLYRVAKISRMRQTVERELDRQPHKGD